MKRRTNPQSTNSNFSSQREIAEIVRHEVSKAVLPAVRTLSIERTEIFSGPIPAPKACQDYEIVLPGFTDRALAMAEKAQESDISARKREASFLLIWRLVSVVLAFTLAFIIIAGGIFLLYSDKTITGFGVLLTGAASIIVAIRKGRTNPAGS